jgi:predicted ArsR family transcriptional regulator
MDYRIDALAMLLSDASRAIRRQFEAQTAIYGLSATQWRLLGLTLRDGPMTQAMLAERLDVEPMSVSRLIDRMEQSGWVVRAPHPEVKRVIHDICAEALTALSDDERRTFEKALLAVTETLTGAVPRDLRPEAVA